MHRLSPPFVVNVAVMTLLAWGYGWGSTSSCFVHAIAHANCTTTTNVPRIGCNRTTCTMYNCPLPSGLGACNVTGVNKTHKCQRGKTPSHSGGLTEDKSKSKTVTISRSGSPNNRTMRCSNYSSAGGGCYNVTCEARTCSATQCQAWIAYKSDVTCLMYCTSEPFGSRCTRTMCTQKKCFWTYSGDQPLVFTCQNTSDSSLACRPSARTRTTTLIPRPTKQERKCTDTFRSADNCTVTTCSTTTCAYANHLATTMTCSVTNEESSVVCPTTTTTITVTPTPAPPPTTTAPCSATNRHCSDACFCSGNGHAVSYNNYYCWCQCRGDFTGMYCDQCRSGMAMSDAAKTCVACVKPTQRQNPMTLSGVDIAVDVPLASPVPSGCKLSSIEVYKYQLGTSERLSLPVRDLVTVNLKCPDQKQPASASFTLTMSPQNYYFAYVTCAATRNWLAATTGVAMTELSINRVHLLLHPNVQCYSYTPNAEATPIANCWGNDMEPFLYVPQGVRSAVKQTISFDYFVNGKSTMVEVSPTEATDERLVREVNSVYKAADALSSTCAALLANVQSLVATIKSNRGAYLRDLYVIATHLTCDGGLQTAINDLAQLTNVVQHRPGWSMQQSDASTVTPSSNVFDFVAGGDGGFEQFLVTRFLVRPSQCAVARPRIVPTRVVIQESSLLMVQDVCGTLIKCCFGSVCANAIRSPPTCVVPYEAAQTVGTTEVTLHIVKDGLKVVTATTPLEFYDAPVDIWAYAYGYQYKSNTGETIGYSGHGYFALRGDVSCAQPVMVQPLQNHTTTVLAVAYDVCKYDTSYYSNSNWGTYAGGWSWSQTYTDYSSAWPQCLSPHQSTASMSRKKSPTLAPLPPSDLDVINDKLDKGCDVADDFQHKGTSAAAILPSRSDASTGVTADQTPEAVLVIAIKALVAAALTKSDGSSMAHVRSALLSAGIAAAIDGEARECDEEAKKLTSSCSFAWSANPAQAGKYLESAGFVAVATSWLATPDASGNYVEGAQFGDVVVIRALPSSTKDDRLEKGHIAMRTDSGWVSDVLQDSSGFPNAAAKTTILTSDDNRRKYAPTLYRLAPTVLQGTNLVALGQFYSSRYDYWDSTRAAACDRLAFCKKWTATPPKSIAAEVD